MDLQRLDMRRCFRGFGQTQVHGVDVKLADVEHGTDQVFQTIRGFAQVGGHAPDLILIEHPLFVHGFHDVGIAANLRQRRAEFVAGNGDKVGFDAVETLKLLFGGGYSFVEIGLFGFAAAQIGHQARVAQRHANLIRNRHQQFEIMLGERIVGGLRAAAYHADQFTL
jgi:hypothetical protein